MQDKEDEKKEKALEKEKRKEARERKKAEKMAATKKDTGLKKMPTQEASTNEKTRKGKGMDTCPICMETFEEVHYDMGDWIKCHCKQWIHKGCIDYDINEPFICPNCV